ncbi:CU044_5270 family protein [Nocardioides sp. Iso805N]|uniref:CU044_5270 family protein n=1 Tax=Nocardioides sp. Iso805N TaxID=1283287 RepID=UPI00037C4FC6|nr:CU044_5270 family protein [Nocardioides sp. Iso805N]
MTPTDTQPTDPWTELERAGQVPPAAEEALIAARVAVRRAATTETMRAKVTSARRRRRLRYAVAVGVAASVVAAGAVTVRLGDREVGGAPAAAAVFERAAHAALAQHDPVVGPGQYLRITLVQRSWGIAGGTNGKTLVGEDGRPEVSEEQYTRTIWIPHDVDAPWTFREGTKVLRNNSTDFLDQGTPTRTHQQPSEALHGVGTYVKTYDPHWYAELPRNPQALLAAIQKSDHSEGSGLAYKFEEVYSEVLRSGLAPAAIRSALFSALAATPGMAVQQGVTTLDGRAGIAIGARGSHFQMIFDARTGQYVGERGTDPDFPDVPGMDRDKTTMLTSVTTTVVDHAPKAEMAR